MSHGKQKKRRSGNRPAGTAGSRQAGANNRTTRIAADQKAQQRRQLLSWLGTGVVIAIVAVATLIVLNNRGGEGKSVAGGPDNPATVVAGQFIDSSIQQNGTVLGIPEAPILVVEYGDYQCPFCVKFHRESMERLMSEYIQSGLIRFEFHEYPIIDSNDDGSFDTNGESYQAAEAARCANDQGEYWPYHNALYDNSLGEFKGSFTPDRLKQIATLVPALDQDAFGACVDNRTHTATVQQLAADAVAAGINSTPTFVINGRPVTGADYEAIKQAIEEQLAGP